MVLKMEIVNVNTFADIKIWIKSYTCIEQTLKSVMKRKNNKQ